jgi:hypothetical protein
MRIASVLTVVRRESVQSDLSAARGRLVRDTAPFQPLNPDADRGRLRKLLPGVILLTVLALLGALFPVVF